MAGKQAKILSDAHIDDLLLYAGTTRQPARNKVMVLLSAKAGLRENGDDYFNYRCKSSILRFQ